MKDIRYDAHLARKLNSVSACSRQLVRLPLFLVANELLFLCRTDIWTVGGGVSRISDELICGKRYIKKENQTNKTKHGKASP